MTDEAALLPLALDLLEIPQSLLGGDEEQVAQPPLPVDRQQGRVILAETVTADPLHPLFGARRAGDRQDDHHGA